MWVTEVFVTKMTYWIITIDWFLYETYGMNKIFDLMRETSLAGLDMDKTPACMAAFMFKSKQEFEKALGDNCLVLEVKDTTQATRMASLKHAESLGWIQDSTSSGFVTWW